MLKSPPGPDRLPRRPGHSNTRLPATLCFSTTPTGPLADIPVDIPVALAAAGVISNTTRTRGPTGLLATTEGPSPYRSRALLQDGPIVECGPMRACVMTGGYRGGAQGA